MQAKNNCKALMVSFIAILILSKISLQISRHNSFGENHVLCVPHNFLLPHAQTNVPLLGGNLTYYHPYIHITTTLRSRMTYRQRLKMITQVLTSKNLIICMSHYSRSVLSFVAEIIQLVICLLIQLIARILSNFSWFRYRNHATFGHVLYQLKSLFTHIGSSNYSL